MKMRFLSRIICLVVVLAVFVCFISVSASAASDRIYAVGDGWKCLVNSVPYRLLDSSKPSVTVKLAANGYFYFQQSSVFISNNSSTVFGRFAVSSDVSSKINIQVNGVTAEHFYNDGFIYFSVLARTGSLSIRVRASTSLPSVTYTLDYVYLVSNSFVPLTCTVGNSSVSLGDIVDCSWSGNVYVDADGTVWADSTMLQSNTWETNIFVPISPDGMILDDAVLVLDLYMNSGVVVGYQIEDDLMNNYLADFEVSSQYLDTQTNVENKYSIYSVGSSHYVSEWDGTMVPDPNGVRPDGIQLWAENISSDEFTQKVTEQIIYDTVISGQDQSSCRLNVDLSRFPDAGSGLYIQLYVIGPSSYSIPTYSISTLGYYINSADADIGSDHAWFSGVKSFFENGISAVVGTIQSVGDRIVNAINPSTSNTGQTLVDQGQQIQDFESEHQEVINQGSSVMVDTLNISGFAPALLFVSSTLDSVFGILGPYQVVIILPVVVGMILFICSKVPGTMRPNKSSFNPRKDDKVVKKE